MIGEYWDGATWAYLARLETNNAGGGNLLHVISPGIGSEMELLYGLIGNDDTAARTHNVNITLGGVLLYNIIPPAFSVTNAHELSFPIVDEIATDGGGGSQARLIIAGLMDLRIQGLAYAQNQEMRVGVVARVRGQKPTVIRSVSAGTKTEVVTNDTIE